jgi:hypothetical protein
VQNDNNHLEIAIESNPKAVQDIPAASSILNGSIHLPQTTFQVFSLYPNPAKAYLQIQLGSLQPQHISFNMYSRQGALLKTIAQEKVQAAIYQTNIDVHDLAPGQYILEVKTRGSRQSYSFMKQ